MKKLLFFPSLLLVIGFSSFTGTHLPEKSSPLVFTGNFFYDMAGYTMDYPCAPDPETVVYDQGQLHENFTFILREDGSVNFTTHLNAMNCSGTGLVSGNNYNLPGSQSFNFNGNLDSGEYIVFFSRYSFRLISQGSSPNARVNIIIRHIYNRNGEEVSTDLITETTCI